MVNYTVRWTCVRRGNGLSRSTRLTKLLEDDRCEFRIDSIAEPEEIRTQVFGLSRENHPIVRESDLPLSRHARTYSRSGRTQIPDLVGKYRA